VPASVLAYYWATMLRSVRRLNHVINRFLYTASSMMAMRCSRPQRLSFADKQPRCWNTACMWSTREWCVRAKLTPVCARRCSTMRSLSSFQRGIAFRKLTLASWIRESSHSLASRFRQLSCMRALREHESKFTLLLRLQMTQLRKTRTHC